jgi:hypothetical protein
MTAWKIHQAAAALMLDSESISDPVVSQVRVSR